MKKYINPATVIATVALFVALGGSSLAAANYIDGASIKPNSIPANRLTQSAVVEIRGSRVPASAAACPPNCGIVGLQAHGEGPSAPAKFKAGMPNTLQHADASCVQSTIGATHGGDVITGGGFFFEENGADQAKFVLVGESLQQSSQTAGDWHWHIEGFYRDANAKDPPLLMRTQAMCLRGAG